MPYILGQWDFYGMTLIVTPDVLIPRDDTVVVTELAIKKAMYLEQNPRILDLCTGSGCIGLAVARRVKDARVTLGDISPAALRVARRNISQLKLTGRVNCVAMDARKPAQELLGTVAFLLSPASSYLTGQNIGCDGGAQNGDIAVIPPLKEM